MNNPIEKHSVFHPYSVLWLSLEMEESSVMYTMNLESIIMRQTVTKDKDRMTLVITHLTYLNSWKHKVE